MPAKAKVTPEEQEPQEEIGPEEHPGADEAENEPALTEAVEDAGIYKGWIKMTHDEMLSAQHAEILIGYHPIKGLGLVKQKETKKK